MKVFKWCGAMILSACICATMVVPQRALAADDPTVGITITPDKTSYSQGDEVRFDVKVINHNDYALPDLELDAAISDGLEFTENETYQMQIGAFETKSYTCLLYTSPSPRD